MRTLAYAWEEAVVSLRRGRWGLLLSIATIAVTFAMLGAFRVVSDNVAHVAEGWTSAAEMSVYLDDVVTDAERTAIRQVLERDTATAGITLVSKEEALARFGAEFPELADVTSSLETNPFPASFDVRLKPESVAAGIYSLELTVPTGFLPTEVRVPNLESWKPNGDRLQLTFARRVLGRQTVELDLERQAIGLGVFGHWCQVAKKM